MRRSRALGVLGLAAALAAAACGGETAGGATGGASASPPEVVEAWIPAPPPGSAVGAAFLTLRAARDDRLLGAACESAEAVELHETVREGDLVRMMERSGGYPLAAGETVTLEPGGPHLMLFGLPEGLKPGDTLPLTLQFERAGPVRIAVEIRAW